MLCKNNVFVSIFVKNIHIFTLIFSKITKSGQYQINVSLNLLKMKVTTLIEEVKGAANAHYKGFSRNFTGILVNPTEGCRNIKTQRDHQ